MWDDGVIVISSLEMYACLDVDQSTEERFFRSHGDNMTQWGDNQTRISLII